MILEEFEVQAGVLALGRRGFKLGKGWPQGWAALQMSGKIDEYMLCADACRGVLWPWGD